MVWWLKHNKLADDSFENVGVEYANLVPLVDQGRNLSLCSGQKQFWFAAKERNGPDGDWYKDHTNRRDALLPDLIGQSNMNDWF